MNTVRIRDTPVARPVPYAREADTLSIRRPRPGAPRLHRIPLPPRLRVRIDVIELLGEERQRDR